MRNRDQHREFFSLEKQDCRKGTCRSAGCGKPGFSGLFDVFTELFRVRTNRFPSTLPWLSERLFFAARAK
jgi:hypothetical protein